MTCRSSSGSRSTASWKVAHSSSVSGPVGELRQPLAGVGPVGVVVGPEPLGAAMAARQVDQLAADLGGGEVVEVAHVLGPDHGQAAVQAHQGGLEQVVGLLPAADVGVATEHRPGQGHEPPLGQRDQPLAGRVVAGPEPSQQFARLGGLAHQPAPAPHVTAGP